MIKYINLLIYINFHILSRSTSFFFINNQKFKQSPRKPIICYTISKQFAGENKRRKINNRL